MRSCRFTSQMASSARHQMSLLILLWTVLGGITSDQRGYYYYWTDPLPTQIQSHLRLYPVLQSSSSHTPVEQVDKKTDCASSLIKLCI